MLQDIELSFGLEVLVFRVKFDANIKVCSI